MTTNQAVLVQIAACFAYIMLAYGVSATILSKSNCWQEDLKWSMFLSFVMAMCEFIWLVGWRTATNNGLTVWSAHVVSVVTCFVASIVAVLVYFREKPTSGTVAALILIGVGILTAALTRK